MLLWHQLTNIYFTFNQWLHIIKSNYFFVANNYFQFKCMPNGKYNVMRIFKKKYQSTIFVDQDAGSYLRCKRWRFLLAGKHLWKLSDEYKWYNNNVTIIRFCLTFWKIWKICLSNWQNKKKKKFMTFLLSFLKNRNLQYDF